jgi:hypothetical protein
LAIAFVMAGWLLFASAPVIMVVAVGALLDRVDPEAITQAFAVLWTGSITMLLAGTCVGLANAFAKSVAAWWRLLGASLLVPVAAQLMFSAAVWDNPHLARAGLAVLVVAAAALGVLWKTGAFPANMHGPLVEHPDTAPALSMVWGRRKQVFGPAPKTRTDWGALAVSWLAVPGVVVAVGLLAAGRWFWAVAAAVAALTLPWWWAGRLRQSKARRLHLAPAALTWEGVAATHLVTVPCWAAGALWAFFSEDAAGAWTVPAGGLSLPEYWGGVREPLWQVVLMAACVAATTWLSGVWLAYGRRRPDRGLVGAWVVALAALNAPVAVLGVCAGVSPVGANLAAGWFAYGLMTVVAAGLVWQLRRWRPIPGVPSPPIVVEPPPK